MPNYQIKDGVQSYEAMNAQEHLLAATADQLSNKELIELALELSPIEAAEVALTINNVQEITWLINDIDKPNSVQMQAMFELCRRYCLSSLKKSAPIASSFELAQRLIGEMSHLTQENFLLLTLDTKNKLIKQHTLFIGTLNQAIVHPRDIFRQALLDNAARIICVHNHPSGHPAPSTNDHAVTKRINIVGQEIGIPLLDHLIIGDNHYFSYAEETDYLQ